MRKLLFLSAALVVALIFFAFTFKNKPKPFDIDQYKASRILRCTPDWNALEALLNDADIPPMPGAGNYQWKISTSSDSAQFYFNQGINMYYGFHIIEAMASFKKAARFDPKNPMVWWAQGLAYGPNINDIGYSASPEALNVTEKAVSLKQKAGPAEQMLIEAMAKRYSADSTQKRETLNQAYADELYKAYQKFPKNADVAALYAEALMLQHPWDFWFYYGKPKIWTPLIRSVLETLLVQWPNHPGANHYYIHVMEASPFAAQALPSAHRLGKLTPGLSHMVHMPSHIYLHTGNYVTGSRINEEAIAQYKKYEALFPAVRENAFLYLWHNQHMQVNCALMAGRYTYAQKSAQELQQSIDTSMLSLPAPLGAAVQYVYMTPVLVDVHFGKWQPLMQLTKPADHHTYAAILYHFAKGMANAALSNVDQAKKELNDLQALMNDSTLKIPLGPYSPPIEGAKVAESLLLGKIALKENKPGEAIAHFEKAVQAEENMVYNEPRDWLLNPKQYLGAAYLSQQQWAKAEEIFLRDLKGNDLNTWSMQGLIIALQKQAKIKEVKKMEEKFSHAVIGGELEKVSFQ